MSSDAADPGSPLTFHEAWGRAKERSDYHKPDWNRASHTRAAEVHVMAEWLVLVRADDSDRLITLGLEREANASALRDQPITADQTDIAWLDACPDGVRRELRSRIGQVDEIRVVDRRIMDVRTIVELLAANLPQRARDHVNVILDLLESEGVTERKEAGP